jgi:glycine oxidase
VVTESPDTVIVGGGLVGLAVAWRSALLGLRVTVVDPEPGQGASWAAAGMLAPAAEYRAGEEALTRLGLASAAAYPGFVAELEAETGMDCGYRPCGTLTIGFDADDMRALDDAARYQQGLGLRVERLTGRECRELEPMLAPGIRGGIHAPGDHQVDNRRLVRALIAAVEARATLLRRRAAAVTVSGGRVHGVRLEDGERIPAAGVVVAAGCWTAQPGLLPELARPPVRPVKGQILRLRAPADSPLCRGTVCWIVQGEHGYLVPRRDGELVLGATMEERGFDTEVTAGAVHDLLRDARRVIPGISEAGLEECRAGLRPGTPDNAPVLGRGGLDGLLLATGHHRNGVLLTPVTAQAIARLAATGEVDPLIADFTAERFAVVAQR